MRPPNSLSPTQRIASFGHALRGAAHLLESEPNARLHAIATFGVLATGWLCQLEHVEWCMIALVVAMVWIAEAFNTALERLCDRVSNEFHPLIKNAKDVSAAAVLFAAMGAAAVGILVFGPHLVDLIR